jgi:glutamyl-tRNA synthetase
MPVRVRYAPSPTGSPHVGNLRTAIYNWLLARKEGGQFIVRLEDTDRTPGRYVPEGIWDIEESLRYLGILPDEWWVTGGPAGPYIQSERLPIYARHAEQLIESGHAYRCYCSKERLETMRQEQQARGVPTGYDRHCRNPEAREQMRAARAAELGYDPPSVVRLAMPLEGKTVVHDLVKGDIVVENRTQDDQVLMKSDGYPTYFLACAVDDQLMGVTHVIRGDDWLSSAAKFVAVIEAFGWQAPKLVHPPLILGPDKKKLSKRHGSTQFLDFIEQGYLPEALFNFLVLLGWSAGDENREIMSVPEIVERFSLDGISEHPAIFDYDKLKWMNGHYIRHSEPGRIIGMCLPYLSRAGLISNPPTPDELEQVRRVVPLEIERMKLLSEVTDLVGFFFRKLDYPDGYEEKAVTKWFGVPHFKSMLEHEIAGFESLTEWTVEAIERVIRDVTAELDVEFARVIHPTRVAATGRTVGPGLFEALWGLGRERTLERLKGVLAKV